MGFLSGLFGGGDDGSALIAQQEAEREARIRRGMDQINQIFAPYDEGFFDQQREAYVDYAMPQVEDQFVDARNQLGFALARQGIAHSSEANRRAGKLAGDRGLAVNDVLQSGRDVANDARRDLERERQTITAQLQATADPESAANAARAYADIADDSERFETIGPLFQNVTAGLVDMTRPTYGPYGEPQGSRIERLFGPSKDRSRVVRS